MLKSREARFGEEKPAEGGAELGQDSRLTPRTRWGGGGLEGGWEGVAGCVALFFFSSSFCGSPQNGFGFFLVGVPSKLLGAGA